MTEHKSIQKIINDRDIKHLVHFTPLNNIESILEKGLYSRQFVDDNIEGAYYTDGVRADGMKEGACLSISFPNDMMFSMKRRQARKNIEWGVVIVDASVMLDLDCAFFPTNAALKDFRNYSIESFKTSQALDDVFCNKLITSKREITRASCLLDKDPTCVQSEVMVFEHIPVKYIKGCVFNSDALRDKYLALYPDFVFKSCQGYYGLFDNRETARAKNFSGY